MREIFVDTDVCIDLLSGRQPFNEVAERLFSMADKNKIKIFVSALSFANIDYILKAQFSSKNSRQIIAKFKTIVKVLSIDNKTIDLAIASDFNDFEDAIQYYSAMNHGLKVILTRNVKDYKKATIRVVTPDIYLSSIT